MRPYLERRALLALLALFVLSAPVSAQTDPTGDWRTWKTAHFRVYARVQDSALARVAAAEAERSYALLARELVTPRGPIELALNDNVDFSNGFTSVTPINRISIYLTAPAVDVELGQYDSWLRVVITHELTHVFHLDRSRGVWRLLQHGFGRLSWLFPNNYQPGWMVEGLAVYYESRLTNGGRERGGFHTQILEGADVPGPNDAAFNSVRWPAGIGRYAFGSRFLALQAGAYGDSVIPRLVENTSGQLLAGLSLVSHPLKAAGGEGVPEGWQRLERHYPRGHAEDRVLVQGLRTEPRLTLAPDGARLAYVHADGRSAPRVQVMDRRGRVLAHHLANGEIDLAWLGDTLLVTQLDYGSPVNVWSDLYRWLPGRGGAWARVTHGARLSTPFAWQGSAGAVRVAHDARQPVLARADSAAPLAGLPDGEWAELTTSPDGHWVAGVRRFQGRPDLVLWPLADPAAIRVVTNDQAMDAEPSWSSDGAWLLFASERSGTPQVYAYGAASGTLVRVTDAPAGAREPSLDGAGTLFYTTMGPDGLQIAARDSALERAVPADTTAVAPPLFEAAPAVALDQSSYAEWWALTPRYWLPVSERVGGGSGTFFGAQTSASDILGRVSYTAELQVAPEARRWQGFLSLGVNRWRSIGLDLGVSQNWFADGTFRAADGSTVTYGERDRAASAGIAWRARGWRSAVSLRVGGELTHGTLVSDGAPFPTPQPNPLYGGGVVSATVSRVQGNVLSMSAEDGVVLSGSYRRRHELGGPSTRELALGSLNWYVGLPLPGFAHWVLAGRVAAGRSGGSDPFALGVGGASGDIYEVLPGFNVGEGRRTFPLRGYPPSAGQYTRAAVGAAELRIPLLLIGRGLWRLPIGLDRVGLTVFGEAGGGWTATTAAQPTIYRDVGAELVVDALGGAFDHRLRFGAAVPLTDGLGTTRGHLRGYVVLGTSF
jgi:hypothetical protein